MRDVPGSHAILRVTPIVSWYLGKLRDAKAWIATRGPDSGGDQVAPREGGVSPAGPLQQRVHHRGRARKGASFSSVLS